MMDVKNFTITTTMPWPLGLVIAGLVDSTVTIDRVVVSPGGLFGRLANRNQVKISFTVAEEKK